MAGQEQRGQGKCSSTRAVCSAAVILKRLTKYPVSTVERPEIGLTAMSFAIRPRPCEDFPSWSLRSITSPEELLSIEERKGRDVDGWSVAAVSVGEVRALGLDVVRDPTDEDPGHCSIIPTGDQPFTRSIWTKLAKKTRIVYTHDTRSR